MTVALALLACTATPESITEVERVQAHLQRAEQTLTFRDTSALTPQVRDRRARLVDRLGAYRRAGRFPKNDDSWSMRPTFVDDDGIRCAMAELIWSTGETELVERVAAGSNHAYVRDLAEDEAFAQWLDRNGLTVAEAARIQPSYCWVRGDSICQPAIDGVSMVQPVDAGGTEVVVREAHGQTGSDEEGATFEVNALSWDRMQPSRGFVVLYREGARAELLPLDREGLRSPGDAQCGAAPRVPMEDVPSLFLDPQTSCRDQLTAMDPRFAGSICDGVPTCPDAQVPDPFEPWPDAEAPAEPQSPSNPMPTASVSDEATGGCSTASALGTGAGSWILMGALGELLRRRRSRAHG